MTDRRSTRKSGGRHGAGIFGFYFRAGWQKPFIASRALTTPMWQLCLPQPDLEPVIGSASGRLPVTVVETLITGDIVDPSPDSRVLQATQPDQAVDHVSRQTGNNLAVPAASDTCAAVHGEAATLTVMGVGQQGFAGPLEVVVIADGAQPGQYDQPPEAATVFRYVEGIGVFPPARGFISVRMRGTGPVRMTSAVALRISGSSGSLPARLTRARLRTEELSSSSSQAVGSARSLDFQSLTRPSSSSAGVGY